MKAKLKAVITITQTYEADSKYYNGCESVRDMIEIDRENFKNDPMLFLDGMLEGDSDMKIVITRVKD